MIKQISLATLAVFIVWALLDFLIHGVILGPIYKETASMWRPMTEFKGWLLWLTYLVSGLCMVLIYARFFKEKNLKNGILYGLLLGIGFGMSMGFGSFAFMPIPYTLAQGWFWGAVVEMTAVGAVIGLIVKDSTRVS